MKVFCRVEHWFFILANAEQPLFFVPNFLVLQIFFSSFYNLSLWTIFTFSQTYIPKKKNNYHPNHNH